ncbi:hypothetical protein [Bradyrhizobium sp. JYMT SZCCT0428]|uniref:hypothetical protein n=1 Tax=Bradyrhizobium sp. JYMT SZCCT0428 TaxID=2807673 RepID=UPI001BA60A0E|nr:hypothetical protein [Bradyrhizobium sp. JYMT SZCCT0428]MBR1151649.1 hypothetical protein [Bradyrhizobium sp. JYMT SZCCT0428]
MERTNEKLTKKTDELRVEDLDEVSGGWWLYVRIDLRRGDVSIDGGLGTKR